MLTTSGFHSESRVFFAVLLILASFTANATDYYVSSEFGDITNPGTETAPFPRIQQAADKAQPGDTIYVMNGEYRNTASTGVLDSRFVVQIRNSGTEDNWIVFRNYPGHKPKLKFNSYGGFAVWAAYIKIHGFEIEGNLARYDFDTAFAKRKIVNSDDDPDQGICNEDRCEGDNRGIGIAIDSPPELETGGFPHHVEIHNNTVYNTPGSGISAIGVDYARITDNLVYRTAWYSPRGQSGISIFAPRNFDGRQDLYRVVITGNTVHSSYNYFECYCTEDPDEQFTRITDGNGIQLDRCNNPPSTTCCSNPSGDQDGIYNGKFLVANNLVFNNGARGINVFQTDNADVFNNTVFGNMRNPAVDPPPGAQITVGNSRNVRVYNNIAYAIGGTPALQVYDDFTNSGGYDASVHDFANNLIFGDPSPDARIPLDIPSADPKFIRLPALKPFGSPPQDAGLFEDTDYHITAKFSLSSDSPAIDAGREIDAITDDINHDPRPQLAGFDIGAYEISAVAKGLDISLGVDPLTYKGIGDQLFLDYRVTNNGASVFNNITITDDHVGDVCTIGTLWPEVVTTCSAVYFIDSDDVANQSVTFSSVFISDETSPAPLDPVTAELDDKTPVDGLRVDTTSNPGSFTRSAERLTVSVRIENNTGIVLTGVSLSDATTGARCDVGSLWPGVSTVCTSSYVVTEADVAAGRVVFQPELVNDQGAVASSPGLIVLRDELTESSLDVSATSSIASFNTSGEGLLVNIDVENLGSGVATDVQVMVEQLGNPLCTVPQLSPSFVARCTGFYIVSEADVADGEIRFLVFVSDERGSVAETTLVVPAEAALRQLSRR